jgi:hypothetical protein
MKEITVAFRLCLCLLLLSACVPAPTRVQTPTIPAFTPTASAEQIATVDPHPKVELDESFYANPQRLGDATQAHDLLQPPEASLISLNLIEGEYMVEVVAEPGAVPPNARVVLVNMETLFFKLVTADDQGAFGETVLGFPGAHILIKQDATSAIAAFDSVENMANNAGGTEFILAPGVIMQIPFESRDDGRVPVATGFCCDHLASPWIFEGSLSSNHLQPGDRFTM